MGKAYKQLSLEERRHISCLYKSGASLRKIAAALDRAPSTISRELKRNTYSQKNGYQPNFADEQAWARRWTGSKLERHSDLRDYVLQHLAMRLSPEQIAGRMRLEKQSITISHESIYRFIYAQIARHKDHSWRRYLPQERSKRGYRRYTKLSPLHHFKDRISVKNRDLAANNRNILGHWESDLMMFFDKKQNLSVTQERKSRYVILNKNQRKHSAPIIHKIKQEMKALPSHMTLSITFDNGPEFAHHHKLKTINRLETYFCDPHKPWQKGGVENMNKRLRAYLPRQTNLDTVSDEQVKCLQDLMNHTPRKCLDFQTPFEVFHKALHFKCESTCQPALA